jgi:hypothetical protein
LRDEGCTRLIVIHDLDDRHLATFRHQIVSALGRSPIARHIVVIPVREIEAWLLADVQAVGKIAKPHRPPRAIPNPDGCVYHHKRGSTVCANSVQIRQEILDRALLEAISAALDEQLVEAAVERALELRRTRQGRQAESRGELERELSLVEARMGHLLEAVKRGRASDVLLETLEAEGSRKKAILRELGEVDDRASIASLDAPRLAQEYKRRATDARAVLGRHVPHARRMLRALLEGRLICEPFEEENRRGYRFRATGTYAGLFAAIGHANDGRVPLGPPPLLALRPH